MARTLGALLAAGLFAGCVVTDGYYPQRSLGAAPSGPGIGWSGPYGGSPYFGSPYSYRRDRLQRGYGGRTFRPSRNVVCDRATETCYRGRDIDASETRDYFGKSAARRVDRIRDRAGTNRIYRADDDVVCNRRNQVCYKDGHPDRSETRDFFGKKAARKVR